jgi:hypothetical protein
MASTTPNTNPLVFHTIGESIIDSLTSWMSEHGVEPPARRWVGFSNPPEDCCPDLVVWADNLRLWDAQSFDGGLRENRLMCNNVWALDYTIRFGVCYWEVDNEGHLLDLGTLSSNAVDLYHIGHSMLGWLQQIRSGIIEELQPSASDVKPSPITSYNQGGCAGWQVTLTVGVH